MTGKEYALVTEYALMRDMCLITVSMTASVLHCTYIMYLPYRNVFIMCCARISFLSGLSILASFIVGEGDGLYCHVLVLELVEGRCILLIFAHYMQMKYRVKR